MLTQEQRDRLRSSSDTKPVAPTPSKEKSTNSGAIYRGTRSSSGAILAGQGPSPEEEIKWAIEHSESGFWDRAKETGANIAGGLPLFALGEKYGGKLGEQVGSKLTPARPQIGGYIGKTVAGAASAFAIDAAIKSSWSAYNAIRRDPRYSEMSYGEMLDAAEKGKIITDTAKAGAIGSLLGAAKFKSLIRDTPMWTATANSRAGQWITNSTKGALNTPLAQSALDFATEVGILTVAPAAFDGTWPGWSDWAVNGTLVGALRLATKNQSVVDNLNRLVDRQVTLDEVMAELSPEEIASLQDLPQSKFEDALNAYMSRKIAAADKIEADALQANTDKLKAAQDTAKTANEKIRTKEDTILERGEAAKERATESSQERLDTAAESNLSKQERAAKTAAKSREEAQSKLNADIANAEAQHAKDLKAADDRAQSKLDAIDDKAVNKSNKEQSIRDELVKEKQALEERYKQELSDYQQQFKKEFKLSEAERKAEQAKLDAKYESKAKQAEARSKITTDAEIESLRDEADRTQSLLDKATKALERADKALAKSPSSLFAKYQKRDAASRLRDATRANREANKALEKAGVSQTRQVDKASRDIETIKSDALKKTALGAKQALKPLNKAVSDFKKKLDSIDKAAGRKLDSVDRRFNESLNRLKSSPQSKEALKSALERIRSTHAKDVHEALVNQRNALKRARESFEARKAQYKTKLAESIDKSSAEARSKIEQIDKDLRDKIENIDKEIDRALKDDVSKLADKLQADYDARIKRVTKSNVLAEQRAKASADKMRESANAKVELAKKEGYFEVDAHELDPTIPKGAKKAKVRFVERLPSDAGKTSLEVARSRIAQTEQFKLKLFAKDMVKQASKFKEGMFDKLDSLEQFAKDPKAFLDNPKKYSEWVDATDSAVRYMIERNQFDYVTHADIEGSGLMPRLERIFGKQKISRLDLDAILASMTSLERQNLGQDSAIPTQDILNLMDKPTKYVLAAKEVSRWLDNQLQRYVDAGMLSADGAKAMRSVYKSYAPIYRSLATGDVQAVGRATSSLLPSNVLKRAKGGKDLILSPTEQILKNVMAMERTMRKNEAMKALSKSMKRRGVDMEEVKETNLKIEELQKLMGEDFVVTPEMVDGINVFKNSTEIGDVQKGWIYHFENGKRYRTPVPVELHRVVRNMSTPEWGAIDRGINAWRNFYSKMVVSHPATILKIGALDPVAALLQTKHGKFQFLKQLLQTGYADSFFGSNKQLVDNYIKYGAARHSLYGLNRGKGISGLADTVFSAAETPSSGVKTLITAPIQATRAIMASLDKFSSKLADAPRLAEYKLSLEQNRALGLGEVEANYRAAHDAWEVTVPYGREGGWYGIQLLNRISPFSRTILASNQSFFKAIDPNTETGRATIATAMAALTAPTLYFYLMNRNHPAYIAEDQYTKENNILIYPSLMWGDYDPHEKAIKIPHVWQFGWLFQKLPESILEYALTSEPEAVRGLIRNLEFNFSPVTWASVSEGIIDFQKAGYLRPEAWGRSRFGGNRNLRTKSPEAQVTPNTTLTSKWLSDATGGFLAPTTIDQSVNLIGASMGDLAMRLTDDVLASSGIVEDRRKDDSLITQHIFRSFITKGPKKYSSHLSKFYDMADLQQTKHDSYRDILKKFGEREAEKFRKSNKYVPNALVQSMYKGISYYANQIARVEFRVSHSAAEKAAKNAELMKLYIQMGERAEMYNKQLNARIEALNG